MGSDSAPSNVSAKLRHYPELGRAVAAAIPNAKLVEFPNEQHTPQLQCPEVFHKALLDTHLNSHSLQILTDKAWFIIWLSQPLLFFGAIAYLG